MKHGYLGLVPFLEDYRRRITKRARAQLHATGRRANPNLHRERW